jgi:hypothetical protein
MDADHTDTDHNGYGTTRMRVSYKGASHWDAA